MSELEKIHDCKKCHGKIVCISVDKLGVTRCAYCNKVVDYKQMKTVQELHETRLELMKEAKAKGMDYESYVTSEVVQ